MSLELEQLILARARLRQRGEPQAADYDRLIDAEAARQGLAAEELEQVVAHVLAESRAVPLVAAALGEAAGSLQPGEYQIVSLERALVPGIAATLALLTFSLGAPWLALGLLSLAVLAPWFPRRIRRFALDARGELCLGRAAVPLDLRQVVGMEVRLHAPRWESEIGKAARTTLGVVLRLSSGRLRRFARGMYFQRTPVRRPVHALYVLRYLEDLSRRQGFRVTPTSQGFIAER